MMERGHSWTENQHCITVVTRPDTASLMILGKAGRADLRLPMGDILLLLVPQCHCAPPAVPTSTFGHLHCPLLSHLGLNLVLTFSHYFSISLEDSWLRNLRDRAVCTTSERTRAPRQDAMLFSDMQKRLRIGLDPWMRIQSAEQPHKIPPSATLL